MNYWLLNSNINKIIKLINSLAHSQQQKICLVDFQRFEIFWLWFNEL